MTSDPTAPSQVLSTFLPPPNFRHFLPFFVLTSYLLHVVCFHRCQKNETNLWFKDINHFSFSLVFNFIFFYFLLCLFFLQIPPQPDFWAVRGSKLASCRPRAQSQFTPNRASGTDIKHTPGPLTPTHALWTPSDHLSFSCSWIEKNTPYYYSECARVVGPLLEQGVEKTKAAAVCISEKSVHFIHWVKETTPLVIDWVRTGQRCFNTGCRCPWCSLFVTECVCFFFPSTFSLLRWTPTLQTVCSRCWRIWRSCSCSSTATTSSQLWPISVSCCSEPGPAYRTPASQWLHRTGFSRCSHTFSSDGNIWHYFDKLNCNFVPFGLEKVCFCNFFILVS